MMNGQKIHVKLGRYNNDPKTLAGKSENVSRLYSKILPIKLFGYLI
jgi:hypothetical protein